MISRTNRGIAPWTVVEGQDPNYRAVTVATILRDSLEREIEDRLNEEAMVAACAPSSDKAKSKAKGKSKSPGKLPKAKPKPADDTGYLAAKSITVLSSLDMSKRLVRDDYRAQLVDLQARLYRQHLQAKANGVSAILVFEGPDAAGKGGGAIRRINEALDARNYQVHGIAAPTRRGEVPSTTSGGFGAVFRRPGRSRSSTAPGTDGSLSSGSRTWLRKTSGGGLTGRSTTSRTN